MSLKKAVNNVRSGWMDGSGPESDIVISSRIRIARNLSDFSFPHVLDREDSEKVMHAVRLAIENKKVVEENGLLEFCRVSELLAVERQILVEKHLISPDLSEDDIDKKGLVLGEDEVISIMINEEDHLRIQCLLPGLQLHKAWQITNRLDDSLELTLDYAFNEDLGYLTACPTNVGTGLRASVMLHLPGLVLVNQINGVLSAISKLGMTVRGLYGEGTEAKGNLFQVSNQITLGISEEEIINNLVSITRQLLGQERAARGALVKERKAYLEDRIGRAYGILKYAHIINSEETMKLLSDVRLGVDLGMIKELDRADLLELMVQTRPAYIFKLSGTEVTSHQRDIRRAEIIRKKLNGEG